MTKYSERELKQLKILVSEDTVKHFKKQPKEVKKMMEVCKQTKKKAIIKFEGKKMS